MKALAAMPKSEGPSDWQERSAAIDAGLRSTRRGTKKPGPDHRKGEIFLRTAECAGPNPTVEEFKGRRPTARSQGGQGGGGRGREGEEGKREVYTSEPIQHARVGGLDPETLNPLPEPRNKAPLYKSPESPTKPPGAPPPSPSPRAQEPKMAACSEKARGHVIAGSMTPSTTLRV